MLVMSLIRDARVTEQPCLASGLNRTSFCVLCVLGSEGSVNSSNCSFSTSDKSQNMKVKLTTKVGMTQWKTVLRTSRLTV